MLTPHDLVAEARTWIGTPFHPNQHTKGLGADCVGLIYGVGLACGIVFPDTRVAYPLRPDGTLKPYLDKHLVIQTQASAGDILLMSFSAERTSNGEPHHLGIYTGANIIHAYVTVRKCIEQPMVELWWQRVRGVYRFKEFVKLAAQ